MSFKRNRTLSNVLDCDQKVRVTSGSLLDLKLAFPPNRFIPHLTLTRSVLTPVEQLVIVMLEQSIDSLTRYYDK